MKHQRIVNRHHKSYDPEIIVHLFWSEHEVVTKMRRLLKSRPSEDFPICLDELREEFRKKWNREQEDSAMRPLTGKQMEDLYTAQQEIALQRRRERRQQRRLETKK